MATTHRATASRKPGKPRATRTNAPHTPTARASSPPPKASETVEASLPQRLGRAWGRLSTSLQVGAAVGSGLLVAGVITLTRGRPSRATIQPAVQPSVPVVPPMRPPVPPLVIHLGGEASDGFVEAWDAQGGHADATLPAPLLTSDTWNLGWDQGTVARVEYDKGKQAGYATQGLNPLRCPPPVPGAPQNRPCQGPPGRPPAPEGSTEFFGRGWQDGTSLAFSGANTWTTREDWNAIMQGLNAGYHAERALLESGRPALDRVSTPTFEASATYSADGLLRPTERSLQSLFYHRGWHDGVQLAVNPGALRVTDVDRALTRGLEAGPLTGNGYLRD